LNSDDLNLKKLRCGRCQLIFRVHVLQSAASCPRCQATFELATPADDSIFHLTRQYLWTLSEAIFDYRHFFYHSFLKPYTSPQSFFTISSFVVFLALTLTAAFESHWQNSTQDGVEMIYGLGKGMALAMLLWPFSRICHGVLSYLSSRAISSQKRLQHLGSEKLVIGYALGSALMFLPFRQIGVMLSLIWFLIMATLGFSIRFELSRKRAFAVAVPPFMLISIIFAASFTAINS
jgi:uncharacterized C2H2 Zn-finger protein